MCGVASSNSPEMIRVGTSIPGSRSVMSQSSRLPIVWNSLGPFIVW